MSFLSCLLFFVCSTINISNTSSFCSFTSFSRKSKEIVGCNLFLFISIIIEYIMVLTATQIEMLVAYRDKAYVSNILCDECYSYNNMRKNLINIPLIFCSSIMTVFNSSSFDSDSMRIPNILLNSLTIKSTASLFNKVLFK